MAENIKVQTVAHVVFEGFTTLDMYGPVQAFASCRVPDGDGEWLRYFNQFAMGDTATGMKSGEGPTTSADYSFEDAPDFDILLIPGGFGTRAVVSDNALLEKIAAMSAKAKVTATNILGVSLRAASAAASSLLLTPRSRCGVGGHTIESSAHDDGDALCLLGRGVRPPKSEVFDPLEV